MPKSLLPVFVLLGFLFSVATLTSPAEAESVSGEVTLPACSNFDSSDSACYFQWRYDTDHCGPGLNRCDNLVIYFAGGGMDCDVNDLSGSLGQQINAYVSDPATGYVAAAACVLESFADADDLPFTTEAQRVDLLILRIRQQLDGVWNGRNLLLSGGSHGAAAAMDAMARTQLDNGAHWQGALSTGVCMYDPPLNIEAREDRYNEEPTRGACRATRNRNICHRYLGPDSDDCEWLPTYPTGLMRRDSIDQVPANRYALRDFKLIACGSGLNPCSPAIRSADGPPEAPIADTCTTINVGNNHRCEFESFPALGHGECVENGPALTSCKVWFEGEVVP